MPNAFRRPSRSTSGGLLASIVSIAPLLLICVGALLAGAGPLLAQGSGSPAATAATDSPPLTLTGVRSFSGPENTRIVF